MFSCQKNTEVKDRVQKELNELQDRYLQTETDYENQLKEIKEQLEECKNDINQKLSQIEDLELTKKENGELIGKYKSDLKGGQRRKQ